MSFQRGIDGSEPLRPEPVVRYAGPQEERRTVRRVVAVGTLACPSCDAPVVPEGGRIAPSDPLWCPFCLHDGAARDFLSLDGPPRPARVAVQAILPAPRPRRARRRVA